MTLNINQLSLIVFGLLLISCLDQENPDSATKDLMSEEVEGPEMDEDSTAFSDIIYVPIYSDIYIDQANQNNLLTATLSIRNTSFTDTLTISRIDYYNGEGKLVRGYIKKPFKLNPMSTANYTIPKLDREGGAGANFIVSLKSNSSRIRPLIQAVMIGQYSNKAFDSQQTVIRFRIELEKKVRITAISFF